MRLVRLHYQQPKTTTVSIGCHGSTGWGYNSTAVYYSAMPISDIGFTPSVFIALCSSDLTTSDWATTCIISLNKTKFPNYIGGGGGIKGSSFIFINNLDMGVTSWGFTDTSTTIDIMGGTKNASFTWYAFE